MDLILDTETTGLGYNDVILELGICDTQYNSLFDKRMKPAKHTKWNDAEKIHNISFNDVENCKSFADYIDEIKNILISNRIIIFNAEYDTRLLKQTCKSHNLDTKWINDLNIVCCMYEAGRTWPEYSNYYGGMALLKAYNKSYNIAINYIDLLPQVVVDAKRYTAIGDCYTTAFVWNMIQEINKTEN